MTARGFTRAFLIGSSASIALVASAAHAQSSVPTAPPASAEPEQGTDAPVEEVTVTGSRISRSDYVANSPIVSLSSDTLENTGRVTV